MESMEKSANLVKLYKNRDVFVLVKPRNLCESQ